MPGFYMEDYRVQCTLAFQMPTLGNLSSEFSRYLQAQLQTQMYWSLCVLVFLSLCSLMDYACHGDLSASFLGLCALTF